MPRLLIPLFAMLATIMASILMLKRAFLWGFIDIPDERKVHTMPTPRTGGIAMAIGAGLTFALSQASNWLPTPNLPWQTWMAGLGFITVGALDDRFGFQPKRKFLIFLCISVLAAWPWLQLAQTNGLPWLPQTWTTSPIFQLFIATAITFWFMAVPNAVNIEDAINGYMGGYTLIVLTALAFRGTDTALFLGVLVGFLVFNWPNARHFMGDAGSFGCGFVLAESLLRGGALQDPTIAITMTLPISIDVAAGIIRRLRLRFSIFSADRHTFPHHILKAAKGNITTATLLLWSNAAIFALFFDKYWLISIQTILYIFLIIFLNKKYVTTQNHQQ